MLQLRCRYGIPITAVNRIFGSKSVLRAPVIDSTRSRIPAHIVGTTAPGNHRFVIHPPPHPCYPSHLCTPSIWPPSPPPSPDCGSRSLTGHADSALLNKWETWSIYAHVPYIEKLFFVWNSQKIIRRFLVACICAIVGICMVFGIWWCLFSLVHSVA